MRRKSGRKKREKDERGTRKQKNNENKSERKMVKRKKKRKDKPVERKEKRYVFFFLSTFKGWKQINWWGKNESNEDKEEEFESDEKRENWEGVDKVFKKINNESTRKWRKPKLILKRSVNEQWKEIKKANEATQKKGKSRKLLMEPTQYKRTINEQ